MGKFENTGGLVPLPAGIGHDPRFDGQFARGAPLGRVRRKKMVFVFVFVPLAFRFAFSQ